MQADFAEAQIIDLPAAVGAAFRRAGERTAGDVRSNGREGHFAVINIPLNQHVAGFNTVERQRTGADLNLRFLAEHVARFRRPRADAAGDALRAQIPVALRAVERHIAQLQTVGGERQRRRGRGKV